MECVTAMSLFMDTNSVDAIVTDPPYELGFMGKGWDASGIANSVEMWREALRVLKPGGHLLAFSGSRTYHRMVCAIEDAGFEIRDQIMWVYGSGFPKSLDVSKAIDKAAGAEREVLGVIDPRGSFDGRERGSSAINKNWRAAEGRSDIRDLSKKSLTAPATDAARQWQGWGTALKPAHEPIVVARKPLVGTVAANVLRHGTGALNIDGCRVPHVTIEGGTLAQNSHLRASIRRAAGDSMFGNTEESAASMEALGRWPANLIHDGSDEVLAAFPQAPGQMAKASEADTPRNGQHIYSAMTRGSNGAEPRADAGSAARFFKEAKWDSSTDAPTAAQSSNLQNALAVIVQNAVATWPSLAGILSSDSTALSMSVTPSEFETLRDCFIGAMLPIESEFLPESLHEKHSPCHSLARVAVSKDRMTGTTTITTSLSRSDGFAEAVTFSITPTSLDRGALDCGRSPARFTYCAKASKSDRGEGNVHPTVKPTDLMRYLCRLVTPPGGTVLDPFMGSGSTGKAALLEGFKFVGIEQDEGYFQIAQRRIGA